MVFFLLFKSPLSFIWGVFGGTFVGFFTFDNHNYDANKHENTDDNNQLKALILGMNSVAVIISIIIVYNENARMWLQCIDLSLSPPIEASDNKKK